MAAIACSSRRHDTKKTALADDGADAGKLPDAIVHR
jgi:hypothetical protein